MFWMIIVNLIGILPHAGYQNVSTGLGKPISGNKSAISSQIKFTCILLNFHRFWAPRADRRIWPSSNEPPDFSLFKKIQNLAQLLLVPELSSFTFVLSGVELAIIRIKTETSFKYWFRKNKYMIKIVVRLR